MARRSNKSRLKLKQPPGGCQGEASDLERAASAIEGSTQRSTAKTNATAEAWGKKRHSYKPLPTHFRRDGFDYRQVALEGNAAIYEQTWSGCSNPSVCYEVIRIRRREGFYIGERFVEPAELYPNSEAWGVDGWTVQDKRAAFRKLREIVTAPQKESANPAKKSPIQNTERCSENDELSGDVNDRRHG